MKYNVFNITYISIFIFIIVSVSNGQSNRVLPRNERPFIHNFSPKDYLAGSQNWCAVQDKKGNLYFGNTKGILQFDGISWETIPIGDGNAVFSLAKDSTGTIWYGSHDDVGFLKPNKFGQLSYSSILNMFADSLKPFGRIRQIIPTKGGLFFRTSKYLFRYNNDTITTWEAETKFYKVQYVKNNIFVYENRIGLKVLKNDTLTIASGGELFKNNPITSIIPFSENKFLISTWKKGLMLFSNSLAKKFPTEIDDNLSNNPIIEIKKLSSERILLVGFNKGSYVIDQNGKLDQVIDKSTGLINELCNNTLLDNRNGLWLCNDYGISLVEIESPFSYLGRNEGINSNVRFITKFKNEIYAVTSDKIYYISNNGNDTPSIKPIDEIRNCWYLLQAGEVLLAATNGGVYEIKNNEPRLLAFGQKKSFYLLQSKVDSNKVYVGTEEGIALVQFGNNKWNYAGEFRGIESEVRQMFEDKDGTLWIGTHKQGIYKSKVNNMNSEAELINKNDGLQNLRSYRIVSIDNQLFFNSPLSATLVYDKSQNKFYNDTLLFSQNEKVSRIVEDENKNIWVRKIDNERTQLLFGKKIGKLSYKFDPFPFDRLIGLSAQYIYPDKKNTWFGTRFGLIKYNSSIPFQIPKVNPAQIRKVRAGDSTLYSGSRLNLDKIFMPKLQYEKNAIRFEYSLAVFEKREAIMFQYFLEGYEDTWSDWTYESQKDYTNLFEGDYIFHVRGKDVYNNFSKEDKYKFSILAPWYRSNYAYISYLLIFGLGIVFVDKYRTNQIDKKNRIELDRKIKRQKELEKIKSEERQIIRRKTAADFHDEFGHLLTKISLFTEMAKKKSSQNKEAHKYLSGIVTNTSQLSSGMKDLIWTLDTEHDSLYDTLIRIKDFGESLFESSDISFHTTGFQEKFNSIILSMDVRRHLILIYKEVMNNCLKYSQATDSYFGADYQNESIKISFKDNGIGIDGNTERNGNGLQNMRNRAENIGAILKLISNAGGTEIIVVLNTKNTHLSN